MLCCARTLLQVSFSKAGLDNDPGGDKLQVTGIHRGTSNNDTKEEGKVEVKWNVQE